MNHRERIRGFYLSLNKTEITFCADVYLLSYALGMMLLKVLYSFARIANAAGKDLRYGQDCRRHGLEHNCSHSGGGIRIIALFATHGSC